MYKIERKDYGIKLTFDGFIAPEEMREYKAEFIQVLDLLPPKFGILSDMRMLKPLPTESQEILSANPELTVDRVLRSATVLNSALVKLQTRRLANQWKLSDSKRYIDASTHADWEKQAVDWIVHGVEPK